MIEVPLWKLSTQAIWYVLEGRLQPMIAMPSSGEPCRWPLYSWTTNLPPSTTLISPCHGDSSASASGSNQVFVIPDHFPANCARWRCAPRSRDSVNFDMHVRG